ncbi:MAG TPA: cyclic nucleotide-binding domain-containing protein [Pyrinomonadaceae bacterium]|nr:cyclic nucleotide-binding domain-containing protein [Pyrinomonadaceae bacterium]
MPQQSDKKEEILQWMHKLDIFSELVTRTEKGEYKHELDLDVILCGRNYTGGRVGPYVRLLRCEAGEQLIREGEWSMQRRARIAQQNRPAGKDNERTDDERADESEREWDGNSFFVLADGTLLIEFSNGKRWECSEQGTTVGAMMLLEGDPADYTASVPEGASATVLEFKRPAIRLLRKYPQFSKAFDEDYRDYALESVLRDVKAKAENSLRELADDAYAFMKRWKEIAGEAQFEVFDNNHVLFQPGQPITHIYMVKKGWVEVVPAPAGARAPAGSAGEPGVHYLGAGNCFGLEAASKPGATWDATATLRARTELLAVPLEALSGKPVLADAVRRIFSDFSEADQEKLLEAETKKVSEARRQEITSGLVDGTNLLVMDMDLCVRCGNCSMACHKVHGQSRLLRRGIQIERPRRPDAERLRHVLAPSVCLHCQDPECLTGCPTGSIGRYPAGQIDINPQTCIGCGDCATQCPYNAISLVVRKDEEQEAKKESDRAERKKKLWDALDRGGKLSRSWRRLKAWGVLLCRWGITPEEVAVEPSPASLGSEPLVAIKCNLCHGTPLNPGRPGQRAAYSCEENCPTGALVRVNPREYFSEISQVIGTIYVDQTHAIGRNIHKRDRPALLWHAGGILATLVAAGLSAWAAYNYGLNTPLPGTVWTLRWLTGFVGLVSIGITLLYLPRKQIYRRRAGPLRYWLLAHVYSGVIGAVLFLVHGGERTGSPLTSALMISFDLVILSGLFGFACYKLAPRIMTRIEGQPLLIEDLSHRRLELYEELRKFDAGHRELLPQIEKHIRRRFFKLSYLWRQFLWHESLTQLQARARADFDREARASKLDRAMRAQLVKAVEMAVMLRRVEALIYLHRLLKLWVAPHVAFTVLMLVLLAVHIVQVILFAVY